MLYEAKFQTKIHSYGSFTGETDLTLSCCPLVSRGVGILPGEGIGQEEREQIRRKYHQFLAFLSLENETLS